MLLLFHNWIEILSKEDNDKNIKRFIKYLEPYEATHINKSTGDTLLHIFFKYYRGQSTLLLLQQLIYKGCNLNEENFNGHTPLYYLCSRKYHNWGINIAEVILCCKEHGMNIFTYYKDSYKPILSYLDSLYLHIIFKEHYKCKTTYLLDLISNYNGLDLPKFLMLLITNKYNLKGVNKNGDNLVTIICRYYNGSNIISALKLVLLNDIKIQRTKDIISIIDAKYTCTNKESVRSQLLDLIDLYGYETNYYCNII
jgi:hypothetical protein